MNGLAAWATAHHLLLLLGLGTAISIIWLLLLRERLKMSWWAAVLLGIAHTVVGVFSVSAFAFLESGFDPASLGNMSLFGGVFFMPLTYILGAKLSKRPLGELADAFTPVMVVTVLCARFNCIVSGCCQGLPVPGMNGVRFPTREAEVLFYLLLLILLCPKVWCRQTNGRAYPMYMIAYGGFRFVTEFFRDQSTTFLFHLSHLWAGVSFCIGISIYAEINNQKHIGKRRS